MRGNTFVEPSGASFGIGALSEHSDCKVETIRYYEQIGLMPEPPRSAGGHRVYSGRHLKRLRSIRRCRSLGFTLDQIRELLGLLDGGAWSCKRVRGITLNHLGHIREKLADLEQMEAVLSDLANRCRDDETPDCPIIEDLFQSH